MHALRVHDFQQGMALESVPLPQPGPGEIRVRVEAAAVSFVDLLIARGGYQLRPTLPFTGGSEFSGVVEALGEQAPGGYAVGDRVSGSNMGGVWAQYLCVPAQQLYRVAPSVSMQEAAVLNVPYGTALYALRHRGRLQPGETLLVLGAAGSVGHAAIELGKWLGARVIAAASSEDKRAAARAAGADETVDTSQPEWREQVKALTAKRGVDVVLDTVGGEMTDAAFRTLGWGGRHLMVGFAGGDIAALRTNLAIVKGASLVGVDIRQFGVYEPEQSQALMQEVANLHRDGRLRPRIAGTYRLEAFESAFVQTQSRSTIGRILVLPSSTEPNRAA